MSTSPLEVMFMPWADKRKDHVIGPFRCWAWDKSRVSNADVAKHLDRYFKGHVDMYGNPVSSITILSESDDFSPVSKAMTDKARLAVDMLMFSVIYPGVKASVRNDTRNMPPPTADSFQLVKQRFTPGDKSFAIVTGDAMHAGEIGKLRVTRPWDVGGFGFPDEELLHGLAGVFGRRAKADTRERFKRSLEWFRLAHTSGDGASALTKLVMMSTAFEILLQIPDGPGKTQKFVQAVEDRICRPQTKKMTRSTIKVGNKAGISKSATHSLPGWWANDFYDLRSRVVHGDVVQPNRLKYRRWLTHLIVADLVFGECIESDLYKLRLIGRDIRKSLRSHAGNNANEIEQSMTDWLLGHSDVHRKLGWTAK